MRSFSQLIPTYCAAALIGWTPAHAEVSAAALWERWAGEHGQAAVSLSAEESATVSGGLELTGATLIARGQGQTITVRFDELQLRDLPDGRVEVVLPEALPVGLIVQPDGESPTEAMFDLVSEGLSIIISGAVDRPDLDYDAARLALSSNRITGPDVPQDARFAATIVNPAGQIRNPGGNSGASHGNGTAARVELEMSASDPDSGATVLSRTSQEQISVTADGEFSGGALAQASLRGEGGKGVSVNETTGPEGRSASTTGQEASHVAIDYAADRITYDTKLDGVTLALSDPALPVNPAEFAMREATLLAIVPTAPASGVQTVDVALKLSDLTAAEPLWSLVDPGGALPRDPGQLSVEMEVDTTPTLNPTATPMPEAIRLRNLALSFAGAALNAAGDVRFVADPSGAPDLARPVGTLNATATGVTGLVQKLTDLGLLPVQQAMMFQMMLGTFATQGEGDTLSTTVEAGEDGSLAINGTRIK